MSIARNPNKPESISPERMEYANRQVVPSTLIHDPRVQTVIDFMNGNIHRKLTLLDLARAAPLSRSQFSLIFKAETELPPINYLKALRLEKARHLLATTKQSIKEIMLSVGYRDPKNFGRCFKGLFGLSPSDYRRGTSCGHIVR